MGGIGRLVKIVILVAVALALVATVALPPPSAATADPQVDAIPAQLGTWQGRWRRMPLRRAAFVDRHPWPGPEQFLPRPHWLSIGLGGGHTLPVAVGSHSTTELVLSVDLGARRRASGRLSGASTREARQVMRRWHPILLGATPFLAFLP